MPLRVSPVDTDGKSGELCRSVAALRLDIVKLALIGMPALLVQVQRLLPSFTRGVGCYEVRHARFVPLCTRPSLTLFACPLRPKLGRPRRERVAVVGDRRYGQR